MADENKNKIDDIFQLMAQADTETAEPSAGAVDPFAIGEITYRDSQGNLKTISNSAPQPAAISAVAVRAGKQLDIEAEAKRIVTQAQLSFPSTELQKRFESIIRSRLKGIRGPIQTREMLLNSPLLGGMGFTDLTADRVLAIINGENSQLHEKLRQNVSQESFADLRAEATKLLDDQDDNEIAEVEPPVLQFGGQVPAAPQRPEPAAEPREQPTVQPQMISRPPVVEVSSRPRIQDVKFKPRLIGPVEEIGSLTLQDYRRLGSSPGDATEKIYGKIQQVEEESFTKKVQAIKAWKQGALSRLYLEIGSQSMEQKIPVNEVIAARQAAGQETLTDVEFEAIADLNRRLRY